MLEGLIAGLRTFLQVIFFVAFLITGALIISFAYKKFKLILGEEGSKKYRLLFILVSILLFGVILYMYTIFF